MLASQQQYEVGTSFRASSVLASYCVALDRPQSSRGQQRPLLVLEPQVPKHGWSYINSSVESCNFHEGKIFVLAQHGWLACAVPPAGDA